MSLPPRALRRALLRATVAGLLAVPCAGIWGAFAGFFVLSLALATIPFSLAELTVTEDTPRTRAPVLWLLALLLVVGSTFQAAYAEGIWKTRSVAGALDAVECFLAVVTKPDVDIGYLALGANLCLAAGVAVSLGVPFMARLIVARSRVAEEAESSALVAGYFVVWIVASLAAGTLVAAVFTGTPAELPFIATVAVVFTGIAAMPGTLALPLVHFLADRLEEHLLPEPAVEHPEMG